MNIDDIEPGTIKDRILQSVRALGELATRSRLNKSVECSNDQILAIAIESLHRDGYIHITDAGHYALADEIAAAMPPLRPAAAAATAGPASTSPVNHSEPDMARTQICEISRGYGCGARKPIDDFYEGSKKCKRCTLDRQKQLKELKLKQQKNGEDASPSTERSTAPKKQAKHARPSVCPGELVIPADGQITCRAVSTGTLDSYLIQQDTNLIACSMRQLEMLRDWATAQIKKAAS